MLKKAFIRGTNSFMYAIGISTVIQMLLLSFVKGMDPVLPEFGMHFPNLYTAVLVQNILIGFTSAAFGAGSVIMEMERISLVVQSILYFVLTALIWIPVGCICWGLHRYPGTMLVMGVSYTVSYVISWMVQFKQCKKNVEQINKKLLELRGEAGGNQNGICY